MYTQKSTQRRLKNEAKSHGPVSGRIPRNPELSDSSKNTFQRKPFHMSKKG